MDPLAELDLPALQALMAQMGPSAEDRHAAAWDQLAATGFGLMTGRGHPLSVLGQAGAQGMFAGRSSLDERTKLRQQSLAQAQQMMGIAKQQAAMKAMQNLFANPDALDAPTPGATPAVPGDAPMPGMLAPVAPGTSPAALPTFRGPNPLKEMPPALRASLAATGAGGDMKGVNEYLSKWGEVINGPNNTLTTHSGRILAQITPTGIQLYNPGTNAPTDFIPTTAKNAVDAQQAGAVSLAQGQAGAQTKLGTFTTAQGDVQLPESVILAIQQSGLPAQLRDKLATSVPADQVPQAIKAFRDMTAGQQTPGPGYLPGDTRPGGAPAAPASSGGAQTPYGNASPGGGMKPNPLATKAAEADIAVNEAERRGMGATYTKQSEKIDADAEEAATLKGQLQQIAALQPQFTTNAAAPVRQKMAELVQAVPGVDPALVKRIAGGDLAAMQEFNKHTYLLAFNGARQAIGGVIRNYQEIEMMLKANPNMVLTDEANRYMTQFMDGTADYRLDKQQERDGWLAPTSEGGRGKSSLAGFQSYFNREHPASDYLPDPAKMKAALEASAASSPGSSQQSAGGGGGVTVNANGKTYTFPDKAHADAFRKAAGL